MKRKTILLILTLLLNMFSAKVMAYDALIDGIYYNLSGINATVTYLSKDDSNISAYKGHVIIPDNFTYGGHLYFVTSIGNYAFSGCTGLTSITIPQRMTSIGERSFYNCTGLTSINIPNSVTSIGVCAFLSCINLTSITIPNSVTSIGWSAFHNCI